MTASQKAEAVQKVNGLVADAQRLGCASLWIDPDLFRAYLRGVNKSGFDHRRIALTVDGLKVRFFEVISA